MKEYHYDSVMTICMQSRVLHCKSHEIDIDHNVVLWCNLNAVVICWNTGLICGPAIECVGDGLPPAHPNTELCPLISHYLFFRRTLVRFVLVVDLVIHDHCLVVSSQC